MEKRNPAVVRILGDIPTLLTAFPIESKRGSRLSLSLFRTNEKT